MSRKRSRLLVPLRFLVLCAVLAGCLAPSQAAIPPIVVGAVPEVPTPTATPLAMPAAPFGTPTPSPSPSAWGALARVTGLSAIGDSIMVDATPNLRTMFPGLTVDAMAGRQALTGVAIMQAMASSGRLRSVVVIGLGTNGPLSSTQLDRILTLAAGRRVVMLTNYCPYCEWVPANNALIADGCTVPRNCTVADWHALAAGHPEWFTDGVHTPIGGAGGEAYAQLVAETLHLTSPPGHARGPR